MSGEPELAMQNRILDYMAGELARTGLVGEERAAKLLYLQFTSRFLPRPLNCAVKGQSSAGKSHLVERVMKLFPPTAYHFMTGSSERSLAYGKEPLVNRILVIAEADGLTKGVGAYLLRSLLSEGHLHYETVENINGEFKPKVIDRPGPTGLLTTTTKAKLEAELETRMFSVPINDTAKQTRAIMLALAAASDGTATAEPLNLIPWHELQAWLAKSPHEVVVPFASRLAEMIPATAVRLRRDFGALLTMIKAHSTLHQAQRNLARDGRIVAEIDDYAAIWELLADLMSEGVGASVAPNVREVVDVVRKAGERPLSITAIAKVLGVHKSTASGYVDAAIAAGYLLKLEMKSGLPAQIVTGDPLPEETVVLPTPDALALGNVGGFSMLAGVGV